MVLSRTQAILRISVVIQCCRVHAGQAVLLRPLADCADVSVGRGDWLTALVTNRCPECAHGSIDQAIDGNGRWQVQWYATPCPVGNSNLMYSITVIDYYWFSLVVSNTL